MKNGNDFCERASLLRACARARGFALYRVWTALKGHPRRAAISDARAGAYSAKSFRFLLPRARAMCQVCPVV